MSKTKKTLNIIITSSFQNDFIEPLGNLKQADDKLKLDYLKSQELWIQYFNNQNIDVNQANVDQFLSWLEKNAKSSENGIKLSSGFLISKSIADVDNYIIILKKKMKK